MLRLTRLLLVAGIIGYVHCQLDAFGASANFGPKPTVPPDLRSFFELDGHARELVDTLMGPRPGGFFPEKTYEIASPVEANVPGQPPRISNLERTLESLFTAPEGGAGALPPGFGAGGFSLANNNKELLSGNHDGDIEKVTVDEEGSGQESAKSSILGIPKVFPKLPKAPIASPHAMFPSERDPVVASIGEMPAMPAIVSRPDVPEGGFLPSSEIRRAPASVSTAISSDAAEEEYGGLSDETSTGSGGLIGTIINLIGLGAKKQAEGAAGGAQRQQDKNALGKAVSNLIGGENSPLPAKNVLSNVLYKALTAGSLQRNESLSSGEDEASGGLLGGRNLSAPLQLTPAQTSAISEQLKMIQNLVIQPTSPLCTSKPEPVDFDFYAFLGQWYQVLYSPPLSSGPCSMVAYKKLSEVNSGGAGSLFEIFEYTTDGTPYSKPKISSGYALVKAPGELIFRTNSNQEDVNVHVIHIGPLNAKDEYEYVVLSTNCNYPLYVFARDPVVYKQKYEASVTEVLERKGLINGFSRLLNIVAPVDNSVCNFPPSLFNLQG